MEEHRFPFIKNNLAWILLALCFCFVAAPDLLPSIFVPKGKAWVTLNDFNYRFSDLYYYVYGVLQFISGNFFLLSDTGSVTSETARLAPYVLSSFWFFIVPLNLAIPLTIASSMSLQIFLMMKLSQMLKFNRNLSFFVALIPTFWISFWSGLPFSDFQYTREACALAFNNLVHVSEYDHLNSNFRFVILNAANVFLFLQMFYASRFFLFSKSFLELTAFSLSLFFCYPPFALTGILFLLSCATVKILRKDFRKSLSFLFFIFFILAFLYFFDYANFYKESTTKNILLQSVYPEFLNGFSFKNLSGFFLKDLFLNKYALAYLPAFFAFKKILNKHEGNQNIQDLWKVLLVFFSFLSLVAIVSHWVDGQVFYSRMTSRGVDIPYVFILSLVFFKICAPVRSFLFFTFFIFLGLPLLGFIRFSHDTIVYQSRVVPKDQIDLIEALDRLGGKGASFAALDFSDIHFATFYTKLKPFVSYVDIQKYSIEENLERYTFLSKMVEDNKQKFFQRVQNSVPSKFQHMTEGWGQRRTPPFLKDQSSYQNSQFAFLLMYWPYVKKAWGIPIEKEGKTDPNFEKKIMSFFEQVNVRKYFEKNHFDYLVLSNKYKIYYKKKFGAIVYENSYGIIVKMRSSF